MPERRLLLRDGRPVRLGSRALDLLVALVTRPGEVVAKDELIARTWPGLHVDEGNLRVHVGALRKALGDDQASSRFIANVPGRGYCFVAPIDDGGTATVAEPAPVAGNLPVPIARVFGREDVVAAIGGQLARQRLITIVGPGGIGKTTVAVAVAERAARPDGVVFVDLSAVADSAAVPGALATLLGLTDRVENLAENLVARLRGRDMILVLDNCEHVIDGAARLAEVLLARVPSLVILATSREPLRASGEWVRRLRPLDVPPPDVVRAQDAMAYASVELFVERASACLGGYSLEDGDAPSVAEICRRLDGIALAIELAAGQLDTIGINRLAASLDDCFRVLARGRRTALPRHQTLRATLDWSFRILGDSARNLLRRLAVFNGAFTVPVACAVLRHPGGEGALSDALADLVAKSLLSVELGETEARYRLLETTRAYAQEKLIESGEAGELRRRHAEQYRAVFERAESEWETMPTPDWLAAYAGHVDNLRAALDWAFSPEGDAGLGVAITVAAIPFWFAQVQLDECHARVQRALTHLDAHPGADERRRMKLFGALGWPQMRAIAGQPSGALAWRRTLDLAERLGDTDYQARALLALWADRANAGEPRAALEFAERFGALATRHGDAAEIGIADRMRARAQLFLGQIDTAHANISRMLAHYVAPVNRSHTVRYQYDQRAAARITFARVLWMQGHVDQAMREVEANIAQIAEARHDLTLAYILADAACAIALLNGDFERVEQYIDKLKRVTRTHSLDVWNTYADWFAGESMIRRGRVVPGLTLLESALQRLRRANFVLFETDMVLAQALGLGQSGRPMEALSILDAALERCARTGEGLAVPELHRMRGETLLLAPGETSVALAEKAYQTALRCAREMRAPCWELRAATSLADLWRRQNRRDDARALLAPIDARFTEGASSDQRIAARRVLESLG